MYSKKLILLVLFFTIPLFSQSDLKVLSSNTNSIVIEYAPAYNIHERLINNQTYLNISFGLGSEEISNNIGNPLVQARYLNIGVPSEFGNTIKILNSSYKEIDGKIQPTPRVEGREEKAGFIFEVGKDYYNYQPQTELVTFDEYGITRGIKTQTLKIFPVKFSPAQNKIKLFTKIVFQIDYSSNRNNLNRTNDNFLNDGLINFDAAKNWSIHSNKSLKKTIANSVLSTGKWFRFEAPIEGMYKITRSELGSYGIDAAAVDPRTIKIYNNGGMMLPEILSEQRPNDLVENAIWVVGEEDGKFDEGDYILFYGRGINFWTYDSTSKTIVRRFNFYTPKNYYWITSGGGGGKRIADEPGLNDPNHFIQNSTKAFASLEEDKINLIKSGRIFLGDNFTDENSARTYTNKLDERLDNFPINYKVHFINASVTSARMEVFENSTKIISQVISGFGGRNYDGHYFGEETTNTASYPGALTDNRSALRFQYSGNSSSAIGYLDYFEISYQKSLKPTNNQFIFYSKDTSAVIEYQLSNFPSTNIKVFDISDYSNVRYITNHNMLSGGECRFQKFETQGYVSEYLAIGDDAFKSPSNPEEINNQNIHGISEGAKFIIITHANFKTQAERLKNYRENESDNKLSTIVVDVNEILNEFSNGGKDPSGIRDFVKYAFDNWNLKPEYVLLFGDATYDFKNIEGVNNNFIPVWESSKFLDDINSYPMDDYYARVDGNDLKLDIAVSRITCQTETDAKIAVDKIMKYEQAKDFGTWRNLITLVADDGLTTNGNDGRVHTADSEDLANLSIPNSFNLDKIYLSAYPTVLTSFGRTKPEVNKAIIKAVNDGTLILNFIGHGSPEVWAHERVFEQATSIPQMVNDKYFLLTAATCDFAYFDLPNARSSTEELILKENSGAIAAVASARPVFSNGNAALNNALFKNLLVYNKDSSGLAPTIGVAYSKGKNEILGDNSNKFHLFGDPTIRLNVPRFNASIDSINGEVLTNQLNVKDKHFNDALNISKNASSEISGSDLNLFKNEVQNSASAALVGAVQLKALSRTVISGSVRRSDNSVWEDFNGEGILSVFDSERSVHLNDINFNMEVQGGVIFRGRVSVVNGRFSAKFVVPKDISYENKNGKAVIYFFNNNSDGIGYTNNLIVGGSDTSIVNDGNGPSIEVYFDNDNSIGGNLINPNSKLIIKLADDTGLNTTGAGVGHSLEGILNEKENDPIDFTNFFTGDVDAGGKSGRVDYKFNNLDQGEYKLKVKAWDVFNNFSNETAYFNVVNGNELVIRDVYNYPNPFAGATTFTFQKNLSSPVDLQIKVYTIAGRLIRNIERFNVQGNFVKVDWDGRDEDGSAIANGTYLYKLIVKSIDGSYNESVLGKLAVIK